MCGHDRCLYFSFFFNPQKIKTNIAWILASQTSHQNECCRDSCIKLDYAMYHYFQEEEEELCVTLCAVKTV